MDSSKLTHSANFTFFLRRLFPAAGILSAFLAPMPYLRFSDNAQGSHVLTPAV